MNQRLAFAMKQRVLFQKKLAEMLYCMSIPPAFTALGNGCEMEKSARGFTDMVSDLLRMLNECGIEPIGSENAARSVHTELRHLSGSFAALDEGLLVWLRWWYRLLTSGLWQFQKQQFRKSQSSLVGAAEKKLLQFHCTNLSQQTDFDQGN